MGFLKEVAPPKVLARQSGGRRPSSSRCRAPEGTEEEALEKPYPYLCPQLGPG